MKRATLLVFLLACTFAFGTQDHTCQGGHNCNGGGDGSGSTPGSTSSSNSTSNATAVAVGTAISGSSSDASIKNSGNSSSTAVGVGGNAYASGGSVKNSGNSSNKNTNVNVAEGGSAEQSQGQDQSQGMSLTQTYQQVRQAPTAIAPDAYPSAPCRVSGSIGASAPIGGISLGGSKMDHECDKRETARSFALIGNRTAAYKILCTTKAAKEAKLTPAECSALESPQAQVSPIQMTVPVPSVSVTPPSVTVNPTPVTVHPVSPEPFGTIVKMDNEAKARLDGVILLLKQESGRLILRGGTPVAAATATRVRAYVVENGIDSQRVVIVPGDSTGSDVSLLFEQER